MKLVQVRVLLPFISLLAACGSATPAPGSASSAPAPSRSAAPAQGAPSPPSSAEASPPAVPSASASREITAADRFFRSSPPRAEWFSESFLRQVPIDGVQKVLAEVKAQLGAYQGVTGSGGELVAAFEHADVPTSVTLDAEGRFTGLFFHPPVNAR